MEDVILDGRDQEGTSTYPGGGQGRMHKVRSKSAAGKSHVTKQMGLPEPRSHRAIYTQILVLRQLLFCLRSPVFCWDESESRQ